MAFFKVALRPLGMLYVRDGRASRREFWSYLLFVWLAALVLAMVLTATGKVLDFYVVGVLLEYLLLFSVLVRRLHDIGRSGWSLLIGVIPLVGLLGLVVWLASPGDAGDNEFGPRPVV